MQSRQVAKNKSELKKLLSSFLSFPIGVFAAWREISFSQKPYDLQLFALFLFFRVALAAIRAFDAEFIQPVLHRAE